MASFLSCIQHSDLWARIMFRKKFVYSPDQIEQMWHNVSFNDCRRFGFFDGHRWYHPNVFFATCDEFAQYLKRYRISDVHVKPLEDNGGREWVIDVDVEAENSKDLEIKINVAAETFRNFFKNNISRIMHSGNRGIHVWLRIDKFPMHASKETREQYYKVFVPPDALDVTSAVPEGCFAESFLKAIAKYKDEKIIDDKPLLYWWPNVDKHVFCNNSQIRVPYSYNHKGKKFSYLLTTTKS
uniref:LEF-1 n=1 Tax=Spodoptera frugiperda nuclear polyhedrosis virus TaxID=10455 RepID=A0A7G3W7L7_NPVSF|nr:LEF-1 [Spodoptera frugiperda multiple nucleopolyhedrovirus]